MRGLRASLWNTRLSLKSRAQLAHYAWRSSEVVFPNKYQVLLDWMGEELAASAKRERHEQTSDDDQAAVWKLYENALSSVVMNEKPSKYSVKQKTIHVLTQLVEKALKENDVSLAYLRPALDVCKLLCDNPSLSQLMDTKFEAFAPLAVVVVKLTFLTCIQNENMISVVHSVLNIYTQILGKQANLKKVFIYACEQLMIPCIRLRRRLILQPDAPTARSVVAQVESILCSSFFHANHLAVYSSAIESSEREDAKGSASYCRHFFSATRNAFSHCPDAIFDILPVLCKSYLQAAKNQNPSSKFQFVKALCSSAELLNDDVGKEDQTVQLRSLQRIIFLLNSFRVYNVVADVSGSGLQLEWLKTVARQLSSGKWVQGNQFQYACLQALIELDHCTVEDCVTKCWEKCLDPQTINGLLLDFVSSLIDVYGKLNQIHVLFNKLLKSRNPEYLPLRVVQKLQNIFEVMPLSQVEEVWRSLITHLKSFTGSESENISSPPPSKKRKTLAGKTSFQTKHAWLASRLLCLLLERASLGSVAISHRDSIAKLIDETIGCTLPSLAECFNTTQDLGAVHCYLHLYSALLNLLSMLSHLQPQIVKRLEAELPKLAWRPELGSLWLQNLDLPCEGNDFLNQPRLYYFLSRLSVQFVRRCLDVDDQVVDVGVLGNATSFLCNFTRLAPGACDWNGQIENVQSHTLVEACWRLFASNLPLLVSYMTLDDISKVAAFILQVFKNSSHQSLLFDIRCLMQSPVFQEIRVVQSALIVSLIEEFVSVLKTVTNDSEALSLLNVLLTRFEKASKRGDDEQADVIESLTATGLGTKGLREKLRDVLESRWSDIAKKASEVVSKCTKRQPSHSSSITSESICRLLEVFDYLPFDSLLTENFLLCYMGLLGCGIGLMLANQSLDPRYFAVWKALLRCADSKKYAICLEVAVSRLQPLLKFFTHCYSVPGVKKDELRAILCRLTTFAVQKASLALDVVKFAESTATFERVPSVQLDICNAILIACYTVARSGDESKHSSCRAVADCFSNLHQKLANTITAKGQETSALEHSVETYVLIEALNALLGREQHFDNGVLDFAMDHLKHGEKNGGLTEWSVGVLWIAALRQKATVFTLWKTFLRLLIDDGSRPWQSLASIVLDGNIAGNPNEALVKACISRMLQNAGLKEAEIILESLSAKMNYSTLSPRQAVCLWEILLKAKYQSEDVQKILFREIPKAILLFLEVLQSAEDDSRLEARILSLFSQFLSRGKMVLMGGASVTVLHGCLVAKLSSTTSSSFKNCCEVLHMLLRHHADAVVGAVSAFIQCVKKMLLCAFELGSGGSCYEVNLLARIYQEMSRNKSFGKYIPYVVADFIASVQNESVGSDTKALLLPGIYALLDLCREHELALLHTTLDKSGKEIFKALFGDYTQHHKFSGKV
ncbi:unhealthy ribosome biogenesis protein 2 homolog [Oscarella lobularis]|uniref:unhealthy ribosome biogenesis protein 2 homolog n=1 Tax=Oscarella lobularis TaxID=121494 RepID=UPI003313E515